MSVLGSALDSAYLSTEDLSDEELVEQVDQMRKSNKIMEMENYVFETFLLRNEPKYLAGMQTVLDQASKIQGQMQQVGIQSQMSINMSRSVSSLTSIQTKRSTGMGGGKRINLQTKIDLLNKEREIFSAFIENFHKTSRKKLNNLRCDLEEITMCICETKESRETFDQVIVKDGVDPITQRIPAEKFVRYMDEWLKSADTIIGKLRLRTSTLKYRSMYLLNQLKQKEELGETLYPVDLDQLKIDHQVLLGKLEQKNADLLDLKKKTGEANLVLSRNKRLLQDQMKQLHKVTSMIKGKEEKIKDLEEEVETVDKEVETTQEKLNNILYLIENYSVPDLMDYIRNKQQVYELKRKINILTRRNSIQQNALEACIKTMKRLTRSKWERASWYEIDMKRDTLNDDED